MTGEPDDIDSSPTSHEYHESQIGANETTTATATTSPPSGHSPQNKNLSKSASDDRDVEAAVTPTSSLAHVDEDDADDASPRDGWRAKYSKLFRRAQREADGEEEEDTEEEDAEEAATRAAAVKAKRKKRDPVEDSDAFVGDCRLCGRALKMREGADHVRTEHPDRMSEFYLCPICGKESSAMARHIRTNHHPDVFDCDVCGRKFINEKSMRVHRKIQVNGYVSAYSCVCVGVSLRACVFACVFLPVWVCFCVRLSLRVYVTHVCVSLHVFSVPCVVYFLYCAFFFFLAL